MKNNNTLTKLKRLLADGETEEVLSHLLNIENEVDNSSEVKIDKKILQEIYLLSARYKNITDKQIKGIINFDEHNTELNRINDGIFNVMKKLERPDKLNPGFSFLRFRKRQALVYTISLSFIIAVTFIFFSKRGLVKSNDTKISDTNIQDANIVTGDNNTIIQTYNYGEKEKVNKIYKDFISDISPGISLEYVKEILGSPKVTGKQGNYTYMIYKMEKGYVQIDTKGESVDILTLHIMHGHINDEKEKVFIPIKTYAVGRDEGYYLGSLLFSDLSHLGEPVEGFMGRDNNQYLIMEDIALHWKYIFGSTKYETNKINYVIIAEEATPLDEIMEMHPAMYPVTRELRK